MEYDIQMRVIFLYLNMHITPDVMLNMMETSSITFLTVDLNHRSASSERKEKCWQIEELCSRAIVAIYFCHIVRDPSTRGWHNAKWIQHNAPGCVLP